MKIAINLFVLLWTASLALGQEITLIRTDVDSSRSSFVTATHNFSLLVKLKGVQNCTGVSFILRHNQTEYVKFSNYRTYPFSRDGSVFVYPWYNLLDNYMRIYSGILSGDTIGGNGANEPEVIELEFSVTSDAPPNSVLEFYFEDAEAVVTENGIGKIIKLQNQIYQFTIHSFVDVWPGDANNDGVVNINDVSTIALYLGYGPSKPNFRSFQRINASTNWFAQKCLAWDSLAITYADCDGDGEITINDMLIIPLNFGKTHQLGLVSNSNNGEFVSYEYPTDKDFKANTSLFHYTIESNELIIGFVAEIPKILSFLPADNEIGVLNQFSESFCRVFENRTNKYILCGFSTKFPLNGNLFCFLNDEQVINGKGITREGRIVDARLVPIKNTLSIEEGLTPQEIISQLEYPFHIEIFDILGRKLRYGTIRNSSEYQVLFSELPDGFVFICIQKEEKTFFTKLLIKN